MDKYTEQQLKKVYMSVFKDVFKNENIDKLLKGNKSEIDLILSRYNTNKKFQEFARKLSVQLAKKGLSKEKGNWRLYYEAAKKLGYVSLPSTYTKFETEQLKNAVQENFKAITSIPEKVLAVTQFKYIDELVDEVAKGKKTRGSLYRTLTKAGVKNAKVIARTETAKLQTAILQNRATSVGSVAYIWQSSNDRRTRPSHKAMNGVVVFWDKPKPELDNMSGHAGEFPNCRCSPEPILGADELTNSNYKLYDYKQHKVINVSRKTLIYYLENDRIM